MAPFYRMYTGLVIGEACHRSPTPVSHISDLAMQMGGPILREVVAAAFVIVLVLVAGSHVVTGALALTTISDTNICSLAWAGVSTAVLFLLALPKTFNQVSYLGYIDFVSVSI
jgi:amino acid permease